jgi:hypothetical protein
MDCRDKLRKREHVFLLRFSMKRLARELLLANILAFLACLVQFDSGAVDERTELHAKLEPQCQIRAFRNAAFATRECLLSVLREGSAQCERFGLSQLKGRQALGRREKQPI